MVDQSHNLKPKTEAMIQTAMMAQELYAKASLIDWDELQGFQRSGQIVDAERVYQEAFRTDVTPALAEWRQAQGIAADPLQAFRESGYLDEQSRKRMERRQKLGLQQSSSYA